MPCVLAVAISINPMRVKLAAIELGIALRFGGFIRLFGLLMVTEARGFVTMVGIGLAIVMAATAIGAATVCRNEETKNQRHRQQTNTD